MGYRIIEDLCIACGACAPVCPVRAIFEDKNNGTYYIDGAICIECGTCEKECPVKAIVEVS